MELQEPTDFSVLLEWEGFAFNGPVDGHLGLGFDVALECVNRKAFSRSFLEALVQRNGAATARATREKLFPTFAEPYFRAERVCTDRTDQSVTIPATFAIVLALAGSGAVTTGTVVTPLPRGTVALVPHAAGDMTFTGPIEALVAMPPAPEAPLAVEFDS